MLLFFFVHSVANMASVEDIKLLLSQQTETLNIKREEDIKKITDILQSTVKTQIEAALEPISNRQDMFETRANEQYNERTKAIVDLQQARALPAQTPNEVNHLHSAQPIPHTFTQTGPHNPPVSSGQHNPPPASGHYNLPPRPVPDLYTMIEKAERTVGFKPLKKSDVDEICVM